MTACRQCDGCAVTRSSFGERVPCPRCDSTGVEPRPAARVTFKSLPAPPGLTRYAVTLVTRVARVRAGTVEKRRGGWWRAVTPDGRVLSSWCSTRREAADACLIALTDPTPNPLGDNPP